MKRALWTLVAAAVAAACAESPTAVSRSNQSVKTEVALVSAQGDYVATPAGWYHRSCVHEIPDGARWDTAGVVTRRDGSVYRIPPCAYASYPLNQPPSGVGMAPQTPTNSGWIEYAYVTVAPPDWFHQLTAYWTVPAAPVGQYSGTQVFYSFPGLQSASYIIQPVVQYGYNGSFGGSYWTMASWYCNTGSNCNHSTPVTIYPSDVMYGSVMPSGCSNGICTWTITTQDVTRPAQTRLTWNDTQSYTFATGGALEVYGLTACNQYPTTGIFYTGITLYDNSGQLSPSWTNYTAGGLNPSCNFSLASTPTTVSLYFNPPPPPPPLSNYIYAQAPYYYAEPSGGYPPYSYLWEWCALDCYGNNAPAAGGAGPNTVSKGWQYLSNNSSVYWTMSGSTLRSTVTDSHSAQAVATYTLP